MIGINREGDVRKAVGTLIVAAAGVGLLWLGLAGVFGRLRRGGLSVNALVFVGALAALVVGEWLCWQAAARHVHPPGLAGRVVNVAGAATLGLLALVAVFLSIGICEIS